MLIRHFNDIHLDCDLNEDLDLSKLWEPVALKTDSETTLVLAGDIWNSMKYLEFNGFSWLGKLAKRFKYIILVLGNHDFWYGDLLSEYIRARQFIINNSLSNVFLLQNNMVDIEGVRFLGATLWTDYNRNNPVNMHFFHSSKDFNRIKADPYGKILRPYHIYEEHLKSRKFIFKNAKKTSGINHVVVVSHHAPSYQSIAPAYKNGESYFLNFGYFSDLDLEIMDSEIDYWFHGHTHAPMNYKIGLTTILNNPRGYAGWENTGYSPEGLICLSQ